MDARLLGSQESSRKGLLGLNVVDTRMNTGDTGTKYLTVTQREGMLLALMPLCFGERLGMVTMVAASRDAGKTSRNDCSGWDDSQYNSGSFHGSSLVYLLACKPSDGYRGCVRLMHAEGQDHPKMQKVGDFNTER